MVTANNLSISWHLEAAPRQLQITPYVWGDTPTHDLTNVFKVVTSKLYDELERVAHEERFQYTL